MNAVTHVAGPWIGFKKESRIIQRCMCCGEVLIDADPSLCAVPEGQDPTFPTFETGALIEVERQGGCTRTSAIGTFDQPEALPENFCLSLVERGC